MSSLNRIFISLDGDDSGNRVGRSVLLDDVAALNAASDKINAGLEAIKSWIIANGGQVISAGGDEMVATLPADKQHDIEELREVWEEASGFKCTVGVGLTMSQSGKALIVGKTHGKDQVVPYSEDVEHAFAEIHANAHEGHGSEEENKQDDAYIDDFMNDHDHEDMDEMSPSDIDPSGEDPAAGSDYYEEDLTPQTEEGQEGQQELINDVAQNPTDDGTYGDVESNDDESATDMGGDEDAMMTPEDAEESPSDIDVPQEVNVPQEDEQPAEHELLNEMIDGSEEQAPDELKQRAAQVLATFKEQKPNLDAIKDQAPELQAATLEMLKVMIEMAKILWPIQGDAPAEDPGAEMSQEVSDAGEAPSPN